MTYTISQQIDGEVPSLDRLNLASPTGLVAAFVPKAGMVGTSLTLDGVELLGRRGGLADYVQHGKTFGIPLLAPWANRLAHPDQAAIGKEWQVRVGSPGVHPDEFGQAMHGLLAGCDAWTVDEHAATTDSARLTASLVFDESLDVFGSFPFAHTLTVTAIVSQSTLRIETTVHAPADSRVPVAFGWHPYFALADTPRSDWVINTPFTDRAELNELKIPTGRIVEAPISVGPLAERAYDDVFVNVGDGASASIAGNLYEISVRYESGYGTAVVYAPTTADVVCFEPMTTPTDPFGGTWPTIVVEPGESYGAVFAIEVVRLRP
jgi:galactose mutarotase-like enzyme